MQVERKAAIIELHGYAKGDEEILEGILNDEPNTKVVISSKRIQLQRIKKGIEMIFRGLEFHEKDGIYLYVKEIVM